jgi:hypothetical protein
MLTYTIHCELQVSPPPSPTTPSPTVLSGGPQTAVVDEFTYSHKVSVCENYGSSCSPGSGSGPGRPSTIDECHDGSSANNDYDADIIKVQSGDMSGNGAGFDIREGSMVTITAKVVTDTRPGDSDIDYLDFFHASDVSVDPIWQLIGTYTQLQFGSQELSANYTIPLGGTSYQAVRVQLRYGGSANACDSSGTDNGIWNDRDDLVFKVQKSTQVSL